ncbi:MAG: 30S ribosomal protein S1 [Candidatus Marinimicrobia bacterium]|jgi:small subunit ribosomal protein S1|nr:30S ribosomal protein S1 [Candidatus Neomarinimicrobiota bacterium]MDP6569064.1 30S ribosomal protein S1 [Candidatus Neomarinimicrobiota bacterium]MDP7026435.1 30S ribosomal protein S1 [Candidatus Neomarinimicrobiota bacterium]|tara:strand:- start:5913 stop:7889 length:1977 start_codon:yes stop_codon:yes gene_type:complete
MTDEKQITESEEVQEDILVEAEESPEELDEITEESDELHEEVNGELIDYLDSDLFNDIRQVHVSDLDTSEELVDQLDSNILQKYVDTISDIAGKKIIEGRVIGQNEKEIIMDIGFKSEGVIPRSEFTTKNMPAIGDVVEVYLERLEDENGQTILSKDKADWFRTWNNILDTFSSGGTVSGTISRRIKGGMIVEVDGIQAFLPGSQIDVHPIPDFDELLGKEMEFRIVKVNQLRKNIVISRKALLEDSLMEKRESLLKEIEVGSILDGRVKNVTDFGVFVDLGGFDGLLHITDLSWGRVKHPNEMVEVGEEITVKVIDIDLERQRISLGLKQLSPHPWEGIIEKYPVGSNIKGKVVSITNYGAFVEIEKGIEGLVHVSEMSWGRNIHHPTEVVQLNGEVEAQVLTINTDERKIALGFKQLEPDPWEDIVEKYPIGSRQKGIVRNLAQFGAFVELVEGVDGLIHVSDLSWTKVIRHPKEVVETGQELEVEVLEVSHENRRIALGLKQLKPDPWPDILDHFEIEKKVKGKIIRVLDKGVILQMEFNVEGIIPARTFPQNERKNVLSRFKEGTELECKVTEVSPEDKKVILSLENIPPEVEVDQSEEIVKDEANKDSSDESQQTENVTVDNSSIDEKEDADITKDKPKDSENEIEGDEDTEK